MRLSSLLLLALFLGAGLLLSGCGDDEAPATPAPAPPPPPAPAPEPEPPAPEAPSVPTGLAVSAATETSITYSWNAVEGASGYEVQFSLNDEDFDDPEDLVLPVAETSFTNPETTPLPPGTTAYLRVRAVSGEGEAAARSAWSTHVTGSTDTPAPPVPDPVMASFSLPEDAKSPYFLVPDGETDEETAMASVNPEIVVTGNTDALIEPLFVEDANALQVSAGENLPFALVDWEILQSAVVEGGATFRVTRVTVGANQEMEASGDIAHVTCGPFGCASGMEAPEVTIANSAACEGWDPSLTLEVGLVDNDGPGETGDPDTNGGNLPVADGYDLGWVSSSNLAMTATHDFGRFASAKADIGKGTSVRVLPKAVTVGTNPVLTVYSAGELTVADDDTFPCEPETAYGSESGAIHRPRGCFRVHAASDYLSNYEVTLAPKGAGVSWGAFSFEDLTCPSVSFLASEQVDVCSLFEAEVEQAHPSSVEAEIFVDETDQILFGFDLDFGGADVSKGRYTAMWYHDGTKPLATAALRRLYGGDQLSNTDIHQLGVVTRQTSDAAFRRQETVWAPVLDRFDEPIYGDLGKLDLSIDGVPSTGVGGDDIPDNYLETPIPCSADDGGTAGTKDSDGASKGDGTLCDAEGVEIETTVVFTDNMGPRGDHACSVTKTYTITCDWDASGGIPSGRAAPEEILKTTNIGRFLDCKVSQ